jgi:hypothetical protein
VRIQLAKLQESPMTTANNLDLNRRLALLRGWTNLTEANGALLGTPPAGAPRCREQAQVPDWAGDWRACGPLIAEQRMSLAATTIDAIAGCHLYGIGSCLLADYADDDAAMRAAIVTAAIVKLEACR